MVSAIYICHWPDIDAAYLLCELLVHRNYHNDIPDAHWLVARFAKLFLELPKDKRTPFLEDLGITYTTYWGADDIFLLSVSRSNVNAMLAVTLLQQMHLIMEQFFLHQHKQLREREARGDRPQNNTEPVFTREAVLDNNALIYELLDECVDFGVIQITDYNILKEYIKMEMNVGAGDISGGGTENIELSSDSDLDTDYMRQSLRSMKKKKNSHSKMQSIKSTHNKAVRADVDSQAVEKLVNSSIVRTQVLPVSWRLKGIFYSKNEIYIDIIETCNFTYDLESATIKSNEILGVCMVRSYLSGMPVVKLGLNEERLSQVEYDGDSQSDSDHGNQLQEEDIDEEDGEDIEAEVPLSQDSEQEPEPKLKKKLKVPLTNVQFHLCVELAKIYKNNLIRFTPPDDQFQLFSFRVEQQRRKAKAPLLLIDPVYRIVAEQNRLQIMCTITTNFKKKLHCRKLMVRVPLHPSLFPLSNSDKDSFRFRAELGEVRYRVDTSEVLWLIVDLPGSKKTVRMMAELHLGDTKHSTMAISKYFRSASESAKRRTDTENDELDLSDLGNIHRSESSKPDETINETLPDPQFTPEATIDSDDEALAELDKLYHVNGASSSLFARLQRQVDGNSFSDIMVDFEIPMLTYSGLRVTYIRVDEESMKYTCFPWVRYLTQANSDPTGTTNLGRYRFRLGPSNFKTT
ncbi:hypothetical protein PUMCH_000618 [Australozyma saopauloensis]|uniref:MHD domain-containing protein n=1 Tax=Australozyma saopauloensis TaxID=291208 RepID=A0AAX4H472_9ASCO|nr:hypothetical protein PUMCH_000618 [[Candida] saopauloensis]